MILLTKLKGEPFYLNCDLIEMVEETPDTVITMTNGKRLLVEESAETIVSKIVDFRVRYAGTARARAARPGRKAAKGEKP